MISFPLHMLPNNAAELVLRHMELEENFSYSLCSKTTKNNVRALNLTAEKIKFDVEKDILVTVQIDFETEVVISLSPNSSLASFPRDQDFKICVWLSATETGIWSLSKFTNQKVFLHLLEIFHHPRLDDLFFNNYAISSEVIEPVGTILDGVKVGLLYFAWRLTEQFRRRAIIAFQNYDKLHVDDFHGQEVYKILIQNVRELVNNHADDMKINQILISNFELIHLNFTMFVEKDFNRFLKLWIRGSNPRLKKFHAHVRGSPPYRHLQAELILKGIKYERIPLYREETHVTKMIGGWREQIYLAGGYIIRGFNGDVAVVLIKDDEFDFITGRFPRY